MAQLTRRARLAARAARIGLSVTAHSPGDGVTRYEFVVRDPDNGIEFGFSGMQALGIGEAESYLDGVARMYDLAVGYDAAHDTPTYRAWRAALPKA